METFKKNKWSDQYVHKRFKNRSFGSLNHEIRARFSKPSRCTNSAKRHSVLVWKNKHSTKCVDRRKMMIFYKYSCLYPDIDSPEELRYDIIDSAKTDISVLIECKKCIYLNTGNLEVCAICNHVLNCNEDAISGYNQSNSMQGIDIKYVLKRKRKKQKRSRKKYSSSSDKYNFEQYWKEMKQHQDECEILAVERKRYSQKTQKYSLFSGDFNNKFKFKICIRSAEKKWCRIWQYNDNGMNRNESFIFQKEMHLNKNMKLIIMYLAIKDSHRFCKNSISNVLTMNYGFDTFSSLKRRNLLEIANRKLHHLSIDHIPRRFVTDFISKRSVNIDQYIGNDINNNIKEEAIHQNSLRFNIMITLQQHTEYEYLQNNVSMKGNKEAVLMDIPMKLKNFTLNQCSIMIHDNDNDTDKDKLYIFVCPDDTEIYLPIYSCPYESIYAANVYPKIYGILQNYQLKQTVMKCIMTCFVKDAYHEDIGNIIMSNLRFKECHQPYYNLLPLSFKLSRLLLDFLPIRHIIKRILIPYIGYNKMHYISMETYADFTKTEEKQIEYVGHQYFEDRMIHWPSHIKKPHILQKNGGNIIDKDIVLLAIDGHEYIDDSDTDDSSSSSSSNGSSVFVDLFGHDSD